MADLVEEWRRTRRLGFMSFVIPVSIILVLSTETLGGSTYSVIRSNWQWEALQKTILYFSLWAGKEVILNIFKYWLMVHAFGMAREHYNLIIGPRSDWTREEVDSIFFNIPYQITQSSNLMDRYRVRSWGL